MQRQDTSRSALYLTQLRPEVCIQPCLERSYYGIHGAAYVLICKGAVLCADGIGVGHALLSLGYAGAPVHVPGEGRCWSSNAARCRPHKRMLVRAGDSWYAPPCGPGPSGSMIVTIGCDVGPHRACSVHRWPFRRPLPRTFSVLRGHRGTSSKRILGQAHLDVAAFHGAGHRPAGL